MRRIDLRNRLVRREFARAHNLQHLRAVEGLVLEKRLGDHLQLVEIGHDDVLRDLVLFVDDPFDFAVDFLGRELAVNLRASHFASKENIFVVIAVLHHAEFVAHAPLHHHGARRDGGLLNVPGGARRNIPGDDFLGDPAGHHDRQHVQHFLAPAVENVGFRQRHGGPERLPAWDDGDLVQRMRVLQHHIDQRMASLVPRGKLLVLVRHGEASPFAAPAHLVARFLQFLHRDSLLVRARRQQRRFVQQVCQLGPGVSRRAAGDYG